MLFTAILDRLALWILWKKLGFQPLRAIFLENYTDFSDFFSVKIINFTAFVNNLHVK